MLTIRLRNHTFGIANSKEKYLGAQMQTTSNDPIPCCKVRSSARHTSANAKRTQSVAVWDLRGSANKRGTIARLWNSEG